MSSKKKNPRKARCVLCAARIRFAPGGEGHKTGRPVCEDCRTGPVDGYTCGNPAGPGYGDPVVHVPFVFTEDMRLFRSGDEVVVTGPPVEIDLGKPFPVTIKTPFGQPGPTGVQG